MTEVLAVDPYRLNAYSNSVSFDLGFKDMYTKTVDIPQTEEDYNPEVSMKKTPSKEWELDVRALISTKKWLMNYGLKRNKLTLKQLLPVIGFKLSDDYDRTLKKPISSKYANGLFNKVYRPDGKTFNITCSREKLRLIEGRLTQAVQLYRRRLDWLTSESRRVFGVIEERGLTVVLDIRNMSPQQFDQYRIAFEKVIYEQLTQVAKFNLIRAADDMQLYQPECVPVTHDTIGGAVQWLWKQDRLASVSKTAACEAVLKAISDPNNEAVYLFTEGTSIETCKEILHEKVVALKEKIPVHVVSYNCDSADTVRSLRDFTRKSGSKFHAYAVIMEMDSYEGQPVDPKTNRANIVLKKKTFGGVPPGAGMRDDVVLLFEELEEARNILSSIQAVSQDIPEPKIQTESKINKAILSADKDEQYMGSKEWLVKYGLHARGLEMFDILSGVAFKHEDGVIDVRKAPPSNTQTDSVSHAKLVNAKYCDKFPVVKWKDGRCVHVQVTPELHRHYEQKIKIAMNVFQQRIDWLNQGSRALFGTVIEDQIYIIIDTSASMLPSIQFLKEKLFVLMQEQLRHKMKVNFVSFNSKAVAWQNRLVEVDEHSLQSAWKWIQNLSCWGSTNTYSALQIALSDPGTQAIYLLTDGRPDQPPKSIIAQVQMQHCVPVHSISFNCNDTEANRFLFDLSRATGGRYHNFSEKGQNSDQPESWESEDIRLLKEEIRRGLESLDKIEELRDECSNLSWNREVEKLKKCSRNHALPSEDRVSAVPAMDPNQLYRTPTPPPRPKSAPPQSPRYTPTPPPTRPKTARGVRKSSSFSTRQSKIRPQSARVEKTPLVAADAKAKRPISGHTRTSLLRTLNSSGRFTPDEWLLPETRQLFETQARKQKELAIADERKEKARKVRKKRMVKANDSSSKFWLSRNGLVAKKLTILDALSPTFVPHEAKYVPILDKYVLSKVFDEILPLAHVSSRSKKKITLINPNAVDLKTYEKKVEKAIEIYERRLNRIVWDALPEHVKEEFESEEPVSYAENKLRLMKALDEAGWPIKEDDITLLEDEIARGEKFIQQSKELRKAANTNNEDCSDDDDNSKSDSAENSPRLTSRQSHSRSESRQSRSSSRQENSPRITTSRIDSPTRSNSARSRDESPRYSQTVSRQDDDDVLDVFDDKASLVSSLTANTNQDYEVSHT